MFGFEVGYSSMAGQTVKISLCSVTADGHPVIIYVCRVHLVIALVLFVAIVRFYWSNERCVTRPATAIKGRLNRLNNNVMGLAYTVLNNVLKLLPNQQK